MRTKSTLTIGAWTTAAILSLGGCATAPEAPTSTTSQVTVQMPEITLDPGTKATQTEKGISVTLSLNAYSIRTLYKVTLERDGNPKNWAGDLAASRPGSDVFTYVQTVTPILYPYSTDFMATVQFSNESQKTITIDGNNGGILYLTNGFTLYGKSLQVHGPDMPFNGGIVTVHGSTSEKYNVPWKDLIGMGSGPMDYVIEYRGDPFNLNGMPKPLVWHMKLAVRPQQFTLVTVSKEVRLPENSVDLVNGNVYECDAQVASIEQFDTALIASGHCTQVLHYNGLD